MREYYSVAVNKKLLADFEREIRSVSRGECTSSVMRELISERISAFRIPKKQESREKKLLGVTLDKGQKEALKMVAKSEGISQRELIEDIMKNYSIKHGRTLHCEETLQNDTTASEFESLDGWGDL